MSDFKFRVYLSWHTADKYLEVLVAPEGEAWAGPAVRTLRKNGVSVGLAENDNPLYVRIKDAQGLDNTFKSIAKRMAKRDAPTPLQVKYLLKKASRMMLDVVDGHGLKFKKSDMGRINYPYA